MIRKSLLLALFCIVWGSFFAEASEVNRKKKKQEKTTETSSEKKKKRTNYDDFLAEKDRKEVKGVMTLHMVKEKLYLEIPMEFLEREMLLGSTISKISDNGEALVGQKVVDPILVVFELGDSTTQVLMRKVAVEKVAGKNDRNIAEALKYSNTSTIIDRFTLKTFNNDTTTVVFDVTPLFGREKPYLGGLDPYSANTYGGYGKRTEQFQAALSRVMSFKAFEDNITVRSQLCYKSTVRAGATVVHKDLPVTVEATRTLLVLGKDEMRPRIADPRIGIFWNYRTRFSTENIGSDYLFYTNRWRVEPEDLAAYEQGQAVKVKKPIVFYIDNNFPEAWKPAVRNAVLAWNKPFEKIRLLNAIEVKDFPTPEEDPEFDPDNLKYSCIRYAPIPVQNAMGPSWIDPRTGEIINASVFVYHDIARLINHWRFVQTAAVDEEVRTKVLPKHIFDESLSYVIRHEIGHCLGFMHNMSASASVPTDSLRSPSYTQKHGTTPCIMDYARFNYVAQPGDKEKGVRLTPPEFGEYDYFLVQWLYQPIAGTSSAEDELPVLRKWLSEKSGNPVYKYGKQQIYQNLDPSAQAEDLGDDPVKASRYGVKNLQYIMGNFDNWLKGQDEDYSHRESLYYSMANQFLGYMKNLLQNVGGIYMQEKFEGDLCKSYESVPKKRQIVALRMVLKELNTLEWMNPEVVKNFGLSLKVTTLIQKMLSEELFKQFNRVYLSALKAEDPFTVKNYLEMLFKAGWDCASAGRMPNDFERLMQGEFIKSCFHNTGFKEDKRQYRPWITDPTYKRILQIGMQNNTCTCGQEYDLQVNPVAGMGYDSNIQAELKPYLNDVFYEYLLKAQAAAKANYNHSSMEVRMYYRTILKQINDVVK